jgi:hypothetical protein
MVEDLAYSVVLFTGKRCASRRAGTRGLAREGRDYSVKA